MEQTLASEVEIARRAELPPFKSAPPPLKVPDEPEKLQHKIALHTFTLRVPVDLAQRIKAACRLAALEAEVTVSINEFLTDCAVAGCRRIEASARHVSS